MAQRELYKSAAASGEVYSPPTFEANGMFAHVIAVPTNLIITATHFYTVSKGDWICLQIICSTLHKLGIVSRSEEPKHVRKQRWKKLGIGFVLKFLVVFLPECV